MARLLEIERLSAAYGNVPVLNDVSLRLDEGEIVAVLGPNGAGKTSLLRTIMRLLVSRGTIRLKGEEVGGLSTESLARRGVIMVQEGRGLFPKMTVAENMVLGAYATGASRGEIAARQDEVFELFPRLRERLVQLAGSMSGGEQQMLAIGRALMAKPRVLLLDEPSLGLSPKLAAEIFMSFGVLKARGLGVLLVEQKVPLALKLASRVYVLSGGRIVVELLTQNIASHHDLARYYLH